MAQIYIYKQLEKTRLLYEEIAQLKAENERLQKQLQVESKAADYWMGEANEEHNENERLRVFEHKWTTYTLEKTRAERVEEIERLREELEEARRAGVTTAKPSLVRDAERYRWLRRYPSFTQVIAMFNAAELESDGAEYLDKAIDDAMKGGE